MPEDSDYNNKSDKLSQYDNENEDNDNNVEDDESKSVENSSTAERQANDQRRLYRNTRHDIRIFGVVYGVTLIFVLITDGYDMAVGTMLQKEFQLTSAQLGFLSRCGNIGNLPALLVVGYFGMSWHIPRTFGICFVLIAILTGLKTLPHFLFGVPDLSSGGYFGTLCSAGLGDGMGYSAGLAMSFLNSSAQGIPDIAPPRDNSLAYGILVAINILLGALGAPFPVLGIVFFSKYVTDMNKLPLVVGFLCAMISFGVVPSSLMAYFFNKIYVDFSDTVLRPRDKAFIGAWWAGLLIAAGLQALVSPIMFIFPRDFKTSIGPAFSPGGSNAGEKEALMDGKGSDNDTPDKMALTKPCPSGPVVPSAGQTGQHEYKLKDIPKTLRRLARNKVFMALTVSKLFLSLTGGQHSLGTKYSEDQFNVSASTTNLIQSLSTGLAFGVTSVLTGLVMSKMKANFRKSVIIVLVSNVIGMCFTVSFMFISCEQILYTDYAQTSGTDHLLELSCNKDCECPMEWSLPVCDAGEAYFSACHAGCSEMNRTTAADGYPTLVYTSCNCTQTGTAMLGQCAGFCSMIYVLTAVGIAATIFVTVETTPSIIITLRSVDENDRAISVGLTTFVRSALALAAGPIFGHLYDSACLIHSSNDVCLYYDNAKVRYAVQGLNIALLFMEEICYITIFIFGRSVDDKYKEGAAKSNAHDDMNNLSDLKETDL